MSKVSKTGFKPETATEEVSKFFILKHILEQEPTRAAAHYLAWLHRARPEDLMRSMCTSMNAGYRIHPRDDWYAKKPDLSQGKYDETLRFCTDEELEEVRSLWTTISELPKLRNRCKAASEARLQQIRLLYSRTARHRATSASARVAVDGDFDYPPATDGLFCRVEACHAPARLLTATRGARQLEEAVCTKNSGHRELLYSPATTWQLINSTSLTCMACSHSTESRGHIYTSVSAEVRGCNSCGTSWLVPPGIDSARARAIDSGGAWEDFLERCQSEGWPASNCEGTSRPVPSDAISEKDLEIQRLTGLIAHYGENQLTSKVGPHTGLGSMLLRVRILDDLEQDQLQPVHAYTEWFQTEVSENHGSPRSLVNAAFEWFRKQGHRNMPPVKDNSLAQEAQALFEQALQHDLTSGGVPRRPLEYIDELEEQLPNEYTRTAIANVVYRGLKKFQDESGA